MPVTMATYKATAVLLYDVPLKTSVPFLGNEDSGAMIPSSRLSLIRISRAAREHFRPCEAMETKPGQSPSTRRRSDDPFSMGSREQIHGNTYLSTPKVGAWTRRRICNLDVYTHLPTALNQQMPHPVDALTRATRVRFFSTLGATSGRIRIRAGASHADPCKTFGCPPPPPIPNPTAQDHASSQPLPAG
ncbi:hypothetical protein PMIN01_02190 [Paraphaeosphaeria minitans]|uniref:Uncharacterized protein n=1 Tax=Paraphaeosphaeria minitans TaxID=565426 RepID=A0A9P6KV07_9PLEO|nr:hypothetical protein PMIN01_02190 [Paraphaeosphaeria minitans]